MQENSSVFGYFDIYEQVKFHTQFELRMKKTKHICWAEDVTEGQDGGAKKTYCNLVVEESVFV